ncbi:MAG: hypothetical protein B7X10_01345 [Burkholderiales bacterium 21-58-4]|nr:MAG: hypothetical protein B7X10_01345 [Burkholderiales bacterium 21-58-4]
MRRSYESAVDGNITVKEFEISTTATGMEPLSAAVLVSAEEPFLTVSVGERPVRQHGNVLYKGMVSLDAARASVSRPGFSTSTTIGIRDSSGNVRQQFVLRLTGEVLGRVTPEPSVLYVPHALPTGQRQAALAADRAHLHAARPQLSRLTAQHPAGFSSQRQARKALAAIVQTDEPAPDAASSAACCQTAVASPAARGQSAVASPAACRQSAVAGPAARGASAGGKRRRTGPGWRASGPFVREALRLVDSLDTLMSDLVCANKGAGSAGCGRVSRGRSARRSAI